MNLEAGLTRSQPPTDPVTKPTNRPPGEVRNTAVAKQPNGEAGPVALERLKRGNFGTLAGDESFRSLRVVQVANDDVTSGGGRAAYRLHSALRRLGHDSRMFVADKRSQDPTVLAFRPPEDPESSTAHQSRRESIRNDYERYGESRPEGMIGYGFTDDRSPYGSMPLEQLPPCDVINLHWFGDLLDYKSFFAAVPDHTPVIWTLHDMNAFTGGCHWDAGCGKFTRSCGACPQLGSNDEQDLSRDIWRRKSEAFSGVESERLQLVSPSHWLAGISRDSSLLGKFPVTTIPNSLDTQTFAPRNRDLARSVFGIAEDANVLLFAADSLVTVRKGFALLAEALKSLADVPNLTLLSVGGFNTALVEGMPHVHLGFLRDDLALSAVYSAADVFVIPSLQDNLPQTAMEAMSCGTPVVGFDAGGIRDMVRPGVTGELAPVKDVDALTKELRDLLLDQEKRTELYSNCRRISVEEFSYDTQAGRYLDLYRTALRTSPAARKLYD